MRESFPRSLCSSASSADNLINRIRRNFRDALTPEKWKMSSANGAPLPFDRARQSSRAQGISFLTHAAVIAAMALMAMHPFKTAKTPDIGAARVLERLRFPSHFSSSTAPAPDPGAGSGGSHVEISTTAGNLVPLRSIQLVRPSLPPKQDVRMPVPPTIFDPAAAPVLIPV